MMKRKGTAKTFIEEHKTGLIIAGSVGLVVLSGFVGWKMCDKVLSGKYLMMKRGNNITDTLISMKADFPDTQASFIRTNINEGFKINDLGKLGEVMMECGAPGDSDMTHFILVGPAVK